MLEEKLQLINHEHVRMRWKYNVEHLQDKTTQQKYHQKLMTIIGDRTLVERGTMDDKWTMMKEAFISLEERIKINHGLGKQLYTLFMKERS